MAEVSKLSDPLPQLIDDVDVFIFDCDGVIWRGDSLIDGIPETLEKLRAAGKKNVFCHQQLHKISCRVQEEIR